MTDPEPIKALSAQEVRDYLLADRAVGIGIVVTLDRWRLMEADGSLDKLGDPVKYARSLFRRLCHLQHYPPEIGDVLAHIALGANRFPDPLETKVMTTGDSLANRTHIAKGRSVYLIQGDLQVLKWHLRIPDIERGKELLRGARLHHWSARICDSSPPPTELVLHADTQELSGTAVHRFPSLFVQVEWVMSLPFLPEQAQGLEHGRLSFENTPVVTDENGKVVASPAPSAPDPMSEQVGALDPKAALLMVRLQPYLAMAAEGGAGASEILQTVRGLIDAYPNPEAREVLRTWFASVTAYDSEAAPESTPETEGETHTELAPNGREYPDGFPKRDSTRETHAEVYEICSQLRDNAHARGWTPPKTEDYNDRLYDAGLQEYSERRLRDILKWGDEGWYD